MGSGITLKSVDPADIPTPDTDKATIFIDSTNADTPSYKDDTGTVSPLGATGPAGPAGPTGPQSIGFVIHEEIPSEDTINVPNSVVSSGGGGGGGTTSGPLASIPAPTTDGELYLPTDSYYVYRADGSAWSPWGPLFPMVEPIDADFAWINQGTASVDTANGGIYLSQPAAAAVAENFRIRKKAAPATPYIITAAFLYTGPIPANFFRFGLLFRQASDGKLHVFNMLHSSVFQIDSSKWTNPTTFSALYTANVSFIPVPKFVFLRIEDDGANRICSYSADGQHWTVFHTVGRTDFLTADEVGFFIDVANTSRGTAVTLLSWKEE